MAKKKSKGYVPLLYTGSIPAKYMLENGTIARVRPGETVKTPEAFVEQRLAEGLWENKPKEEVKKNGD